MGKLIVGFHQPHLSGRGTTHAMYDYARYNESILGNTSIIFYQNKHPDTDDAMEKIFNHNFKCLTYDDNKNFSLLAIQSSVLVIYNINSGENNGNMSALNANAVHAVFNSNPHGHFYAYVSKHLANMYNSKNYVPHIISLKLDICDKLGINKTSSMSDIEVALCMHNYGTIRGKLGIPIDGVVVGRYGGYDTFDIPYLSGTILKSLEANPNLYFIFMGTKEFCQHSRVYFLEHNNSPIHKTNIILSSDYMIHGRLDGESFGISIGEFSAFNRQIITTKGKYNNHLDVLDDKAIIYNSEEELLEILSTLVHPNPGEYNQYAEFSPENVMLKFQEIFLPFKWAKSYGHNIVYNTYDSITANSIAIGKDWKPYISKMIDIIGDIFKENGGPPVAAMDIGAHIGIFSVKMMEKFQSLHILEPDAHNLCLLNFNMRQIERNNCKLQINNTVFWDNNGQCFINSGDTYPIMVEDTDKGGSKSLGDAKVHYAGVAINGSTLDEYCKSTSGAEYNIGLIKINVNGGEFNVLSHGKNALNQYHPYILFSLIPEQMKNYKFKPLDVMSLLKELKYEIIGFKSSENKYHDFVAVYEPNMKDFQKKLGEHGLKTRNPVTKEIIYELPHGVSLIIDV